MLLPDPWSLVNPRQWLAVWSGVGAFLLVWSGVGAYLLVWSGVGAYLLVWRAPHGVGALLLVERFGEGLWLSYWSNSMEWGWGYPIGRAANKVPVNACCWKKTQTLYLYLSIWNCHFAIFAVSLPVCHYLYLFILPYLSIFQTLMSFCRYPLNLFMMASLHFSFLRLRNNFLKLLI